MWYGGPLTEFTRPVLQYPSRAAKIVNLVHLHVQPRVPGTSILLTAPSYKPQAYKHVISTDHSTITIHNTDLHLPAAKICRAPTHKEQQSHVQLSCQERANAASGKEIW
jgi:hypothetical protein